MQETDWVLAMDVIERTQTEWASPIVFVPKKYGTLCFCIDSHKLNPVAIQKWYWTPSMIECIELLDDSTIFSTLDADSRNCKVEIAEDDREKTEFMSHYGFFRFPCMPFE